MLKRTMPSFARMSGCIMTITTRINIMPMVAIAILAVCVLMIYFDITDNPVY